MYRPADNFGWPKTIDGYWLLGLGAGDIGAKPKLCYNAYFI